MGDGWNRRCRALLRFIASSGASTPMESLCVFLVSFAFVCLHEHDALDACVALPVTTFINPVCRLAARTVLTTSQTCVSQTCGDKGAGRVQAL
jgi:hypothetical protein